jgi:hypothetical protein
MAPLRYSLKTSTDVEIPIPEEEKNKCKICNMICKNANALAGHVGAKHKIKLEDYLVNFYMQNERPKCPICNEDTRYLKGEYCFKKYCTKHANHSRKEWCLEKGYGKNGFESWRKGLTKDINLSSLKQSLSVTGRLNPSFLSAEQYKDKCNSIMEDKLEILTSYEEFKGIESDVNIKCNICLYNFSKPFKTFLMTPRCPCCDSGKSSEEKEVFDYVQSLSEDTQRNIRNLISKEIDIFSSNKSFAIEYNGLYWHTEDRVGQKYHSSKLEECKQNNINLMHVFSDEWKDKKNIVKSMISNRMKCNKNKIYARNCIVRDTDENITLENFFETTHISGHTRYKKAFYLEHNGVIVAALSLRNSFHKKYNDVIEIARFSNQLFTNVIGSFSRLIKYAIEWCKKNNIKSILTYADLRFGQGEIYLNNGFTLIGKTRLDYWYTNGKVRYNRFKYRAQPNKTEKEVAKDNCVKKIYGCGSNIYTMDIVN